MGLFLLISVGVFGQKDEFRVSSAEESLGKNLLTGSDIKGIRYDFPERIHKTFLDTTSGLLTVQLRGLRKEKWLNNKGNILQYDLLNNTLLWSKKIMYQVSSLQQFSNTMIFTRANKSYCLDIRTGEELWEVKNNIYHVDPMDNIGIGYRFKTATGYTNQLEGIDLSTGNVLWEKELNREYGWNQVFYTNDSTLMVVAAGLHALNIFSGQGWDYNTITGKKDYTTTVAANAAGVALGLLTGTFVTSTGHDLVREVVSNVLVDSAFLYFSSKEQLAKIDKQNGELLWKYPFPKDVPSKSAIFMNDSALFMINKGYAFMGNRTLDFGKPFIAAFDKLSGQQVYFSFIDETGGPILGFKLINQQLFLVFKNKIAQYSQATGDRIREKAFPDQDFGDFRYFVGDQAFITNPTGDLVNLNQSDTTKLFVYTTQGKTLALDHELNVSDTIDYEDLSIYYLRTKDFKFIEKDKHTLIVDNEGKSVAEVEVTSDAFLIGETLYDKSDNSFFVIDLKDILKKE